MTMLGYLRAWEDQIDLQRRDEDFKNLVFAHDIWPPMLGASLQNFKKMFPEVARAGGILTPEEEDAIDWVVPQDMEDMEDMIQLLREAGYPVR